jgi:acyl carrier protein
MRSAVYSQLTEIFADLFDNDSIVLTPDTTADEIEEWDSLHHVTLIVAIESRFGIKFKTAELEGLRNVGHLVELIERKREQAGLAV